MAGHATTVARPYAEAVFERARETGRLGDWSETLQCIAAARNCSVSDQSPRRPVSRARSKAASA